jgi:hypothetical protein
LRVIGLKPIFVFDGAPPSLKKLELEKRFGRREEASMEMKAAEEPEEKLKFEKRTLKVTAEQNEECKSLFKLMGIPIVDAPSEAEAQCANMVKDGKVNKYIEIQQLKRLTLMTNLSNINMNFIFCFSRPMLLQRKVNIIDF